MERDQLHRGLETIDHGRCVTIEHAAVIGRGRGGHATGLLDLFMPTATHNLVGATIGVVDTADIRAAHYRTALNWDVGSFFQNGFRILC